MFQSKNLLSGKSFSVLFALILFSTFASVNAQDLKNKNNNLLALLPSPETQAQTGIVEKDVTVFGQKIHYREAGSGPTIVLIHGLGGDSLFWAGTMTELSKKYRVIAPDQIGFGQSDKPFLSYRIGTYVDFLDSFLAQLKVEKAHIAGISLGGWIAATYTLTYPNRVEKLILVDAAGYAPPKDFDPRFFQNLFPTTRAQVRQSLSLIVYNNAIFNNDFAIDFALTKRFSAGDGYTIQQIIESVKRGEDFYDGKLGQIKNQTLIIWGKQDGLITLDNGERLKKEIPNSQLVVIDKCGHGPPFEKPAEFNETVSKFLSATN